MFIIFVGENAQLALLKLTGVICNPIMLVSCIKLREI
jgi:hypothetical protein